MSLGMSLYTILLSNSVVVYITAPLRRLRCLITVEDDLIEEGVLPPHGFGGVFGCARFLYQAGGGITLLYRGAFLEAALCFVKYELQRTIAIPISRRVHLDMQHAYLATTLLHTTLTYLTVTPVQVAVDTVVVNAVSDFVLVASEDKAKTSLEAGEAGAEDPRPNAPSLLGGCGKDVGDGDGSAGTPSPSSVRPRFDGVWATMRYLARHFPIRAMVGRLFLLEFGCRYASSLVNNKILGYLMNSVQRRFKGGELTSFQRFAMYAGCPLLASLVVSALTYPLATYPMAHFLRLRSYERSAAAQQRREAESVRDYPSFRHYRGQRRETLNDSRYGAEGRGPQGGSHPHEGANTTASFSSTANVTGFEGERFWWEELLCHGLHADVQDHLWMSMYGPSEPMLMSTDPTPTSSPIATSAGGAVTSPSTCSRGLSRLYRGYGLAVASILVSAGLAMIVNPLTSRVFSTVVHR